MEGVKTWTKWFLWSRACDKVHSFPKGTQHFWSCLSFGEECTPVNLGLYLISTMLMATTCQKPPLRVDHGSLTILKCFNKMIKTLCKGHWPRGTKENGQINVAFLLEKSVFDKLCGCDILLPLKYLKVHGHVRYTSYTLKEQMFKFRQVHHPWWTIYRPGFSRIMNSGCDKVLLYWKYSLITSVLL